MKKISIIIYILICSNFVFGQEETSINWRTYFSPKDNFSIEVPNKVKEIFLSVDEGNTKNIYKGGQYKSSTKGEYFYIFSAVIPNNLKESVTPSLPPWVKTVVDANTKEFNSIKIGNYFGTQWNFKDSEEFTHKVVSIQTKTRVLIFHVVVEKSDSRSIDRFFSSIEFYNSFNTVKLKKELNRSILLNKEVEASKNNYIPVGQNNGNGSGSGLETSAKSTSLQITSKPRPPYTDLARFYQIEGLISLRVTFLADGKIGEITPVTKLPFGLTTDTINAAKQLTFLPPTKDGIPYPVTKTLQYTFSLY